MSSKLKRYYIISMGLLTDLPKLLVLALLLNGGFATYIEFLVIKGWQVLLPPPPSEAEAGEAARAALKQQREACRQLAESEKHH